MLDPRSGDVLTLVSLPAYDPNAFAGGIDRAAYQALITDKLRPLQNRAIQGRYSPGSTFKLVVATAALEEGLITPVVSRSIAAAARSFYGRYFQCHLKGGHGSVDLRHAIEKSCNVYFYTLGNMLGVDRIHKWAVNLGLARQERHRPAERTGQPGAVIGVEEAANRRAVVSGRDDFGGHWSGTEFGDARWGSR